MGLHEHAEPIPIIKLVVVSVDPERQSVVKGALQVFPNTEGKLVIAKGCHLQEGTILTSLAN